MKNPIVKIKEIVWTIEDFLWVETKDSQVIPFKLNNKQNQLVGDIIKSRKPRRVIILKGRQFGFSTLLLALLFIKCLLVKNTRAVVIAHDIDASKKLFKRVRFFADTLIKKPTLSKESEKEYGFPNTNSHFYIGTAGTRTFGRGDNITDLHCSEVAFWEDAPLVMNGLLQAVGKTGNVYIETTANGLGGRGAYFYRLWTKASGLIGAWSPFFYSWIDFKEYEMKADEFIPTKEELILKKKYPTLNNKKLAWRRWKISETESDGSLTPEKIFQQEYPLDSREAFIASGNCIFNTDSLLNYETSDGEIVEGLIVWKKPSGYSVMGVDVSEGLTLETNTDKEIRGNHDLHCIQILDENLEQMAEWTGVCDMDEFADQIVLLSDRYNSFVGVESNGPGLAVLSHLKKKMRMSRLYHREVYDENYKKTTKKLGWITSTKTKPLMLADMVSMTREQKTKINSEKLIVECLSAVRDEDGRVDTNGKDKLMAYAIALQMYKHKPPTMTKISPDEKKTEENERKWRLKRRIRALKRIRHGN